MDEQGFDEITAEQWDKAKHHLGKVIESNKKIALATGSNTHLELVLPLDSLRNRYISGERSDDLYLAMVFVD